MGRYVTVQNYSDGGAAPLKYEQTSKGGAVPEPGDKGAKGFKPERVNNVMGSVAGSGSGDFHHYRADRRRETLRLAAMDAAWKKQTAEEEFARRVEVNRMECEERTRKRAEKRRRKKQRAAAAKAAAKEAKKNKGATPSSAAAKRPRPAETAVASDAADAGSAPVVEVEAATDAPTVFEDDGSFLAKFLAKKKAEKEAAGASGDKAAGDGDAKESQAAEDAAAAPSPAKKARRTRK